MKKENIFFTEKTQIGISHQPLNNMPQKMSRGSKVDEIRDIKDIAKAVREYVKKKYPDCKFSVKIERYSGGQSMSVTLLEAPFNPLLNENNWQVSSTGNKYYSVNHYHFERNESLTPEAIELFKDVRNFYNQYNYNHSDSQSDYFNVRFYETLAIGEWDKGFVQTEKKSRKSKAPAPKKDVPLPKYGVGYKVSYRTSKGFEVGKVVSSKFIASRDSYLYQIENPRGGIYNVWESNIISGEKTPEPKFKVGDIVREKGLPVHYIIASVEKGNSEYVYICQNKNTESLRQFSEGSLELVEDKFEPKAPEPENSEILASVTAYSFEKDGTKVVRTEEITKDNVLFRNATTPIEVKEIYEGFWKGSVVVTSVKMQGVETDFETEGHSMPKGYEYSNFFNFKDILYNKFEGQTYWVVDEDPEKKYLEVVNFSTRDVKTFPTESYDDLIKGQSEIWTYFKEPFNTSLAYINVLWSESAELDTEIYSSWSAFQKDLDKVKVTEKPTKTRVIYVWNNGKYLIDDLIIQKHGKYNPDNMEVGVYLMSQVEGDTNIKDRKSEVQWFDFPKSKPENPNPTPETPMPENKYYFKVGDVFRRNYEDEIPPNTKITYTILSIGSEKTQYRINYLDKGTERLATKSNEKIQEEITTTWWIPYEQSVSDSTPLALAIEELKETNDALWQMYIDSENKDFETEARLITNDNCTAIKEFSEDLYFDAEKFLGQYFEKATKPIAYNNKELTKEEFFKIVNSKEFIDWFGDFKRSITSDDPALFSKVLKFEEDEKGIQRPMPLIVYHGTWNKSHFSRFKFNKFPIIYFARNKSYAEWFAKMGSGIMYECFLDIKYICDFRGLGLKPVTWDELSEYLNKDYGIILPSNPSQARMVAWAWIRNDAPELRLINTIKEKGFTGMVHIENNPQDKLSNGEDNTTEAYMIFNPEQAKLVRYISSGNAFTDIFFMKKGGKVKSALLQKIKNLKV